ncbi:MAG TPA: hypothetical protein VND62_04455 [Acidimicrobiales bacterium]|nr:hypothetical protein [Acidimicrobiales bacterium]
MWMVIAVGAPVLVLALAIAIWPVFSRSYRYSRWEHQRSERRGRSPHRNRVRTHCPVCAAPFDAETRVAAVNAKHAHVVRSHARRGAADVQVATPPAITRGA